jgi:hypothetical protein
MVIDYPANTVALPVATKVQPASPSPTLASGLPFTNTVALPEEIVATWGLHGLPGRKCGELISPTLAAGFKLTNTVGLPVAMLYPLQCGTP